MLNVSSAMGGLDPGHSDSATVAPLRLQLYVRQAFVPQLTLDPFPSLRSSPQQPSGGQTEHSARVKQVHVAMSARGASVVGELVGAGVGTGVGLTVGEGEKSRVGGGVVGTGVGGIFGRETHCGLTAFTARKRASAGRSLRSWSLMPHERQS